VSFVGANPEEDEAGHVLPYNKYGHLRISEQQARLPIYAYERDVLYLVERHATSVIVGETGCGKSTQIPQYLHRAGWAPRGLQIVVTQPSSFAVVTVAARVAEEMRVRLGDEVAYAVDFEDVSRDGTTRIKFCTTDVLIREMASDPLLSKYSVVMVDEAHERTLSTDLLLGLLKKIQRKRNLRLVISSASIHAEKFALFFSLPKLDAGLSATVESPSRTPGMLSVQGRPHGVRVFYLQEPCQDYVRTALETVYDISKLDIPGDVLVFLTTQDECERAVDWVKSDSRRDAPSTGPGQLHPVALYAGLPTKHQLSVFEAPPRDHRKIVFATSIAETSLTIDGIVHVVDCMFSQQRAFDPFVGVGTSGIVPISKASASQRSGRAGRVRPGFAFRLCTKEAYDALREADVPEVQRSDLTRAVLQLKGLGIDNLLQFSWMATPPSELLVRSLESLYALGALGKDARLSDSIGRYMTEFAGIDPRLARCILASWNLSCVYEVVTIVSMLHVRQIWSPGGKKSREARSQFAVKEGDLITYLNVWRGWEENRRGSSWAYKNYIRHKNLCRALEIRNELLQTVSRLKRQSQPDDPVFSGHSLECMRDNLLLRRDITLAETEERIRNTCRALAHGLFLNAAELVTTRTTEQGQPMYRLLGVTAGYDNQHGSLGREKVVTIHRDSVTHSENGDGLPPTICFYDALQAETGIEARIVHPVEAAWLAETGYFDVGRRQKF
jgi:ATP-dependent RNA helicase DDX35